MCAQALVLANSVTSDTVGVVLFAIRVAARLSLIYIAELSWNTSDLSLFALF